MTNYVGLSFMIVLDMWANLSFAQILAIPLCYPLLMRELNNRMYKPSSYYLAQWLSSVTTYLWYAIVNCALVFPFLELHNSSFTN